MSCNLSRAVHIPSGRTINSGDVLVLGGGISGITTALALQSLGLQVNILAAEFPLQSPQDFTTAEMEVCWRCWRSSQVATTYAMASAYPHHLQIRNLNRISDDSQTLFGFLFNNQATGIHVYRMYEVFEHCPESAPLFSRRMKFQAFDGKPRDLQHSINPPQRPGAEHLWGWTFETYFADMPEYVPFLWSLFAERGGVWQMSAQSLECIIELAKGRPVINCLGLSAASLFNDPTPAIIVRGRQVVVPEAPIVTGFDGLPLAYNYTPPAEIFSRADGHPEYVHFFPRRDGWILGQTREPGRLNSSGRWQGDAVLSPEIALNVQAIPSPIVQLNVDILKQWINHDLDGKHLIGREGYRYYRDPEGQGVRLEYEEIDGTPFVHNYGHGGSGITVSWGCALEVARILTQRLDVKPKPGNTGFSQELNRLVISLIEQASNKDTVVQHPENQAKKKNEEARIITGTSSSKPGSAKRHAASPSEITASVDWQEASISQLIDHIVSVHHAFLNQQLPRLSILAQEVAAAHSKSHPELNVIRSIFQTLKLDLEEHAIKEEQVLFPSCLELKERTPAPIFHCGSIHNPILVLESEHHDALEALAQIRQLTNNYQAPEDARAAYLELYAGLSALEIDLRLHIHKEDKILFPKVLSLVATM